MTIRKISVVGVEILAEKLDNRGDEERALAVFVEAIAAIDKQIVDLVAAGRARSCNLLKRDALDLARSHARLRNRQAERNMVDEDE